MLPFFCATAAEPLGPPAPSLATLDVAAANIWGIPDFVHPRFKNLERLQGAAGDWLTRARERHDVVAIQEAWNGMWRQDLANLRILLDLGVVMGRDPAANDVAPGEGAEADANGPDDRPGEGGGAGVRANG